MAYNDTPGMGGGVGGGIGTVIAAPVAAGVGGGSVLPATGILPATGASDVSLMVIIAAITFGFMLVSRISMLAMRSYLAKRNA